MENLVNAQEHLRMAYAFEEERDLEEALAECNAAVEVTEGALADALNLRGTILEGLGRKEDAVAPYEAALWFDPDLSAAADNLFELEAELGRGRELVTVAAFRFSTQAHAAKARLESHGIRTFLADEGIVLSGTGLSSAFGGVMVRVREGDVEQAVAVLRGEE
jgi:tetratricopeptide (TPR) repeat protein